MIKKELEKLRALNATPAMINALQEAGREKDEYSWKGTRHRDRYHLAARCQNLNGILKVSICTREDIQTKQYTPKWDIFINYLGDEYITRERQQDGSYKWRTAYIYNLENGCYWYPKYYDEYIYMNPEGTRQIKYLLKTKKGGYKGIEEWQTGCKRRQADAKIKKLTDKWDEAMKPIKDPPKGFDEWWKHNAFDGKNYIFYAGAGAKEGYCTSCLKKVELGIKPRHHLQGTCPKCRRKINYISRAKKKDPMRTGVKGACCIQRYKDGFVQREFHVERIDVKDKISVNKSEFMVSESKRILIQEYGCVVYVYADYKRRGFRWTKSDSQRFHWYYDDKAMYSRNIGSVMRNSHTAYPIARKNGYIGKNIAYFLAMEKEYPVIEMAYKAGLYVLGADMIKNKWQLEDALPKKSKNTLAGKLGIDNARMQRLKSMGGNLTALQWLQYEKEKDVILRNCDIITLQLAEITPELMVASKIAEHLSIEKICNYLEKQHKSRKGGKRPATYKTLWMDWEDYVDMMDDMQMDCSNELLLKPKDLEAAHNELVARISMMESKKEIEKTEKKFPQAQKIMKSLELKKYEYKNGKYCIVAPTQIADIYEEGLTLKHCIHTCDIYFQRIEIQETYLLFLRKAEAPDRPWYTIEIEPGGNIRQKKSTLNEAYKDLDDAIPFLKEWQQFVKKKMSKKDKELAQKSDQARREGYENLRKERKIIWHGRMQGTLLADALEDDFMAAE